MCHYNFSGNAQRSYEINFLIPAIWKHQTRYIETRLQWCAKRESKKETDFKHKGFRSNDLYQLLEKIFRYLESQGMPPDWDIHSPTSLRLFWSYTPPLPTWDKRQEAEGGTEQSPKTNMHLLNAHNLHRNLHTQGHKESLHCHSGSEIPRTRVLKGAGESSTKTADSAWAFLASLQYFDVPCSPWHHSSRHCGRAAFSGTSRSSGPAVHSQSSLPFSCKFLPSFVIPGFCGYFSLSPWLGL